jgi:hypothetical protein
MQHTTKKNTYSIRKNMEHHRTIEPYVHHCIPTISAYRRKNTHTKKKKTREKEKQPDNAVYLHYTIATKKNRTHSPHPKSLMVKPDTAAASGAFGPCAGHAVGAEAPRTARALRSAGAPRSPEVPTAASRHLGNNEK